MLDNNDHKLKQGMVAQIKIITQDRKQSLVVPKEAIFSEGATEYLYLIKEGHAVKREVSLGMDNGSQVEILTPRR
ncbi:hypothetical protein JCM15060_10010 [Halanaerobaculum tunisiense]